MGQARGRPRQDNNRILRILVSLHLSSIASTAGRSPHAIPPSVFFNHDPCDFSLFSIPRQWYDRDSIAKPSNLDHSKVTRYNFAFFQPNEKGDIWGTDSWADAIVLFGDPDWNSPEGAQQYCSWDAAGEPPVCEARMYETGLISQAHSAGVEVYPSIGGWTLSNLFPQLAADPKSRVDFANNCVKLIEAYDFDGIDIE
jgi:GH18 family chitinase